jgi:hypothetical protein
VRKRNNLQKRELLGKYLIARDCMEAVAESSGLALALKIDHTHPLYKSLHDAVVISYGRAFTEMRPLGTLPDKWKKFDDINFQKTHQMLMYHRSKNVGHTDLINGRIRIYPVGSKLENGSIARNFHFSVLNQSFAPNELIAVQKLAGNITGRLLVEINNLFKELYGENGEQITGVSELFSQDELIELRQKKQKS